MSQSVFRKCVCAVSSMLLVACSASNSQPSGNASGDAEAQVEFATADPMPGDDGFVTIDSDTDESGSDSPETGPATTDTDDDATADAAHGNESDSDDAGGSESASAGDQTSDGVVPNRVANGYVLVRNERLRLDGSVFGVVEFDIDDDSNTITRSSSYPNGINSLTAHETLHYDSTGNFASRRHVGESADNGIREAYEYDADGFLTGLNAYFLDDGYQFNAYEYRYRADGKIETKYHQDESTTITVNFVYDDTGSLVSSRRRYQNRAITRDQYLNVVFEQSPGADQIVRAEAVEEDGDSVSGYSEYQYDANGNLIQIDWFREDGEAWFIDIFHYEPTQEPVFNYWLFLRQFFPEHMRHPV